jgi:tRNA threonylcarbamoyladenosine biosynthesis protein TsaE
MRIWMSQDVAGTQALAAAVARALGKDLSPRLFCLEGPLGAGKTAFVQGLARGLGVIESVTSPTFGLIREHALPASQSALDRLAHMDFYRLAGAAEARDLGLDDELDDPGTLVVIEWPERAEAAIPPAGLRIAIQPVSVDASDRRRIVIRALDGPAAALLADIDARAAGLDEIILAPADRG